MPGRRSIFKELFEKRRSLAVKVGLTGVIFILISLLAKELVPVEQPTGIMHIANVLIELSGKIGEAFILSGFVVFVLEEHPLAMMVKDVSRSIIDEIIDKHFQRDELIGFIVRSTKNLNKYEVIDEEIYNLYEKHGLLELTSEPRKSNASIIFKKIDEFDSGKHILINRIYEYRATNEAREGGSSKLINGDGLAAFFDSDIPVLTNPDEHAVIGMIEKYLNAQFKFSTSFEIDGQKGNLISLQPVYLDRKYFDSIACRPKNNDAKEIKPELYGVYELLNRSDVTSLLKLNFYFNVKIPPKEFIEIFFEVKGIVSEYDLWTYEFISYTKGATFELQLGDEFETKIEEVLIGVPTPPIKSDSKLKYNGWIMPHSSISGAWRRKVKGN